MATNGYDRELLEELLGEIDAADENLASLQGTYMQQCKGPRADIETVFKRAKEANIPTRAFKTIVKNRRLDRKMAANIAKLEDDDQASYDRIVADLGDFVDLPLGQAALRRARPADATLDSLA